MTTQEMVANAPQYLQIGLQVVGVASAIAAVTPTPKDDGILFAVRKILDFLACNWGSAKNQKK